MGDGKLCGSFSNLPHDDNKNKKKFNDSVLANWQAEVSTLNLAIWTALGKDAPHVISMNDETQLFLRAPLCMARSLRQRRVRPSVCLSHAGIVPNAYSRANAGS